MVDDMIYENRFTSSHKIVDEVRDRADDLTTIVEADRKLYRARIYHRDPLRDFIDNLFQSVEMKVDCSDYYNMEIGALYMSIRNNPDMYKTVVDNFDKWKRKSYKGYDSKQSEMASVEKTSSGRINPAKISYQSTTGYWQTD